MGLLSVEQRCIDRPEVADNLLTACALCNQSRGDVLDDTEPLGRL
jgi:hypothetical protein